MGLDMYLSRKVSGYKKPDGTLSKSFDDYKRDQFGRSNRIEEVSEVGYWRKSNQIHAWFVDTCQGGEDDCREYDVTIEQLQQLRDLCFSVLKLLDGKEIRVLPKDIKDFEKFRTGYGSNLNLAQRVKFDVNRLSDMKDSLSGFHTVNKGLSEQIKAKLPSRSGFFFGNTDYNGWYIIDLIDTIAMLDQLFLEDKELRDKGFYPDYTYQASW